MKLVDQETVESGDGRSGDEEAADVGFNRATVHVANKLSIFSIGGARTRRLQLFRSSAHTPARKNYFCHKIKAMHVQGREG